MSPPPQRIYPNKKEKKGSRATTNALVSIN
jgi:hypothetical protein